MAVGRAVVSRVAEHVVSTTGGSPGEPRRSSPQT